MNKIGAQNAPISAILIMKPILLFPAPKALETTKSVFWKPAVGGLPKNRFL
jgi:hypothetical protein